jgi:ATP-dependent DNA helicase
MPDAKDEKKAVDLKIEEGEEQLLNSIREDTADGFLDTSSSLPIDLEAKNGDACFITEAMTKEEEQLHQARLKVEEEEEAKRREAARQQALDPKARFSKLDELLTKTQLYSEFLLEKMEQITDVCWLCLSLCADHHFISS